ncbi:MAG TPA: fumarylacetoacetate hydrolase family protein [Gammaproteobacteria bacterium]|nr:fumarylacetoacetate hydrolase family protein [Gammaproteobacteria bacterium]
MRAAVCSSVAICALAVLVRAGTADAQQSAIPYKLGMFGEPGRSFVGLVLDDAVVVDLSRAEPNAPATLRELIERWDEATAERIAGIAAAARRSPPAYAFPLDDVRTLAPLEDPDVILMAARNYVEHAEEMAAVGRTSGTTSVIDESVRVGLPGVWTRDAGDRRPNPYLFPKLKTALAANGDAIVLPPGRPNIDYECELVAVIGRSTRRVSVDDALDYVFGYMAMVDVSDREERADGRYGSDWFMGKSHDTFGPSGPFVVPAEFVGDPQALDVRYTLNGNVMQDASTALMVHTVRDLVSFASYIVTLKPGDLIGTGTPGGVGEGRTPPVYLEDGDRSVCTIERIGTLSNPVRAAASGMH